MDDQKLQRKQVKPSHRQHLPWSMALCVLGCLSVLMWTSNLHANDKQEQKQDKQQATNTASQSADDLDAGDTLADDPAMDGQSDDVVSQKKVLRRPGKTGNAPRGEQRNEQAGDRRANKRPVNATELQEEDMPDALAVLHDYRPELVKRFQDWAERHPENARRTLSRSVPMMTRLVRMRRDDPAGYRLAIEDLRAYRFTSVLSKQLKQAQEENDQKRVEELSIKLRTVLTRHFEVRQQIREREIQKLQDRVDQLRESMDNRVEKREQILNSRFEQLSTPDEKTP